MNTLFDKHFTSIDVHDTLSVYSQAVINTIVEAVSIQVPYIESQPGHPTTFHMWKGREVLPTVLPFQAEAGGSGYAACWKVSVQHAAVVLERYKSNGVALDARELIDVLDGLASAHVGGANV